MAERGSPDWTKMHERMADFLAGHWTRTRATEEEVRDDIQAVTGVRPPAGQEDALAGVCTEHLIAIIEYVRAPRPSVPKDMTMTTEFLKAELMKQMRYLEERLKSDVEHAEARLKRCRDNIARLDRGQEAGTIPVLMTDFSHRAAELTAAANTLQTMLYDAEDAVAKAGG